MEKFISDFFKREKIKYYSCMDVSECDLLYPAKLPANTRSVCFFLIPYNISEKGRRNISLYCVPRDYHLYIKELSSRFEDELASSNLLLEYRFFADNSPFCERTCAEKCGIGKIGKNGLIINSEYGSFVFIGSLCLSSNISITQTEKKFKGDICGNCEKCKTFCPGARGKCRECLSAITQKKKVTDREAELISKSPIKWGCDICQLVCPYNRDVSDTPIEFFKTCRVRYIDKETLLEMSDEEFSRRAYAWRGREVIKRNLDL